MAFALLFNFFRERHTSAERSRNGLRLLSQDSVVISEHDRCKRKLGEGSYSKVYVGKYLGKDRAIKVFKKEVFSTDRITTEFEKLNSFKHPNIVRVYGMWEDPFKQRNSLAIVMELCDGSLHQFVQQQSYRDIPSEQKLKILHDITSAMIYLHSLNIIHGDLRTPNVLINKTNDEVTAKLSDFGMSRLLTKDQNAHFTASRIDDDYLPPEVYDHEYEHYCVRYLRLTRQVDIFCFGPIVIELLCGQFPRPGPKVERRKNEVVKVFTEIERREEHLMMIKPGDRMYGDLIVEQCMADNPADRASFEELQLIVEGFQRKYDSMPHKEILENKQREIERLRSAMEPDQGALHYDIQVENFERELAIAEENLMEANEQKKELQRQHEEVIAKLQKQCRLQMEKDKTALQDLQSEVRKLKAENDSLCAQVHIFKGNLEQASSRTRLEETKISLSVSECNDRQNSAEITMEHVVNQEAQLNAATTTERSSFQPTKTDQKDQSCEANLKKSEEATNKLPQQATTSQAGQIEMLQKQVEMLQKDSKLQKEVTMGRIERNSDRIFQIEQATFEQIAPEQFSYRGSSASLSESSAHQTYSEQPTPQQRYMDIQQPLNTLRMQAEALVNSDSGLATNPHTNLMSSARANSIGTLSSRSLTDGCANVFQSMPSPGPVKFQRGTCDRRSIMSLPATLEVAMESNQFHSSHPHLRQGTVLDYLLKSVRNPNVLQQGLTLPKLMEYLPDLAGKGLRIAGYLGMQKQWGSLPQFAEPLDRLQTLIATWLDEVDYSEAPHSWGFFIALVLKPGISQHKLARRICDDLNKLPAQ